MSPWIDRNRLIQNVKEFIDEHGYFFRNNAKRISSLVEIAVYNSIVQHYKSAGFTIAVANLGLDGSFKYKITASGIAENFSYFRAMQSAQEFHILQNISIQSAHGADLYFNADVVVAKKNGATTHRQENGRRHSFVVNAELVTFAEVKHVNPFPEALFNFTGLVLELKPGLIERQYDIQMTGDRLCPIIAFTGVASTHSERIRDSLVARYGINITFGTSMTFASLTGFDNMRRYAEKQQTALATNRSYFARDLDLF